MGYRGKCYYPSEREGSWTDSQSRCSAPGASLAGIDSEQEMAFLLHHKGVYDHWIGLRREQGQPWTWANGTKFGDLTLKTQAVMALGQGWVSVCDGKRDCIGRGLEMGLL
ncbi:unnamed protein product, partial [Lepidochelys olivacea]